jgi:pilus assembly protein CpaE
MSRPQILVHRTDKEIDFEFEQTLAGINGMVPVFHYRDELKDTINSAAAFQPAILMIQLEGELDHAKTIIDECIAVAPDVTIVGICQLESGLGGDSNLMLRALQIGVEDFIRRPISNSDLRGLLSRRLDNRREKKAVPGTLVSFISNKGGVGKSTCAVNAAVELAQRHPEKVLLVDGSLQMGVCAAHLNLEPHATITDAWNQRDRLDDQLFRQLTTVHESGLHLMAAPESAIEAAEIDDEFIARILLLARRTYDFVVIDTFPLFDRTIMAILDLSDTAYIVAENVVPTLKTVRGFFQLLTDVGFVEEKWRIVINRFATHAGSPNLAEVERYVGQTVDHVVPWDKKFVLAANVGQPLLMSKIRWNKSLKALGQIVDSIESDAKQRKSSSYDSNYDRDKNTTDSVDFNPRLPSANDLEGA